jgi:hypothetical protein
MPVSSKFKNAGILGSKKMGKNSRTSGIKRVGKITIFWIMMPRSLVGGYHHFREIYYPVFTREPQISTLGTSGTPNINNGNKFKNLKNSNLPNNTSHPERPQSSRVSHLG